MNIYVNGRFRAHKMTGVQRVAHEITRRLSGNVEVFEPASKLRGWRGHLWEQTVLPRHSRNGVLWSPCASGPVSGLRHVVTFHDLFPIDSPHWYTAAYAGWHGFALRKLALTASHLIAVSEYTKKRLVHCFGVDAERVTVIHNGVDEKFLRASIDSAPAARAALRLPAAKYLLCVGSLEPRKNLKRLLAAWGDVVHELPADVWLVVAGSCDSNVYHDSGPHEWPTRVFQTGYVPDEYLPGLYAGSLGFVYPSLAEGFGLPPLEAMACGVPVIASSTTALPEVCSSAALYCDPTSASDIAQSMKQMVGSAGLRLRLSVLGRERAACFNWERTAQRTLDVLRDTASPAHCVFCE